MTTRQIVKTVVNEQQSRFPQMPEMASELRAPEEIRTPNLLIRRHGRTA